MRSLALTQVAATEASAHEAEVGGELSSGPFGNPKLAVGWPTGNKGHVILNMATLA